MSDNKPTALFTLHQEQQAKITSFAGYSMPLHYPSGIIKEHQHTREQAGLFDISHMGQISLTGEHCALALEQLVPSNIQGLKSGMQRYTVLCNESGGVIDDLIIANLDSHYLLIVNASRKTEVMQHLQEHLSQQCTINLLEDQALLALQGPLAVNILQQYSPAVALMTYMSVQTLQIKHINCTISRSGYTGEDGFEISVANSDALVLAQILLAHPEVLPIGLGARDSLRLEAGLCLYGHELSASITPVEARLSWLIAKDRSNYLGAKVIQQQLKQGAEHYRVGIQNSQKSILRENTELQDKLGNKVGYISSGSFGASLLKPVAMAYLQAACIKDNTPLYALQRGKATPVSLCPLPFVKHRYSQRDQ